MATYTARVMQKGELRRVQIIADDQIEARKQAKKLGRIIALKRRSDLTQLFKPGMRGDERIVFLQRLSMMVESRVAMGQALNIMRTAFQGAVRRAADELYRRIEQGADFGESILQMKKDFPDTTAALINSGVRGGDLPEALRNAADFELEMDEIRRTSSKGMAGAVGTFLMSAAMILGTSLYVGPAVVESELMQQGGGVDIDWVFAIANGLSWFMGVLLFGALGLLSLTYIVKPIAPSISDRIVLKIPIYRDLVLAKNNYTVFHGLGLLIGSGVRMEEGLQLAADAAPRGEVRNDLQRAHRAVRNGKPWAMAMQTLHPTDIAALSTSQDRDQIAKAVQSVARQYRKIYTQRIQEVVPGLQMLSALFMAIAGGLIFGMVILPMLQLTQNLL